MDFQKINCWFSDQCKKLHCNDKNGCLIIYKLNYLFDQACISDKQRKHIELRIDDNGTDLQEFLTLKNIQDNILDFVNNGKQLYIHSSMPGNGKTSWALRLIQEYFKKIWLRSDLRCKALFINVPKFLLASKDNITEKNSYYEHIKENVLNCDIVIWDDIGTKVASSWDQEQLLSIIDQRINNGKANIFTSNLNEKELREVVGDRLASRISNLGYNIEFKGGDKRSLH